jgi:hypothetical protein
MPDGATCTACGAPVPTGRIRILASRDDLTFVELPCDGCGSSALGLLLDTDGPAGSFILDVATDGPAIAASTRSVALARPIDDADVEALRLDLAAWQGDLVGWLEAIEPPGRGSALDR